MKKETTPNKTEQSAIIAVVVGQTLTPLSFEGAIDIKTAKSLPVYSAVLPKYKVVSEKVGKVDGRPVNVRIRAFPPDNILVEVHLGLVDPFHEKSHQLRDDLLVFAEQELRKQNVREGFKEEYAIFTVAGYRGSPNRFLKFRREIVGLIRSENIPLSDREVEDTIRDSSLQYTANDLAIVDWDGAFLFDPNGEWQETIDLLEVANVHLLRLRVLDRELDERLGHLSMFLTTLSTKKPSRSVIQKQMAKILRLQTISVTEFTHAGRDIQLIGDWYAAKLYTLISRKFHLDEWRRGLRDELDSLRTLTHTAADHFGVSAQTRAEFIEIALWLLLAVGYIFIFFLDARNAIGG